MRNNVPRYVVIDYAQLDSKTAPDDEVMSIARRFVADHHPAFEELAK